MNGEQVEQKVDHVAAARRCIEPDIPNRFGGREQPYPFDPRTAQAHAQIAIAEELRGIREVLRGVTGGGIDRYLKVRNG